jgi:hypothetical protein
VVDKDLPLVPMADHFRCDAGSIVGRLNEAIACPSGVERYVCTVLASSSMINTPQRIKGTFRVDSSCHTRGRDALQSSGVRMEAISARTRVEGGSADGFLFVNFRELEFFVAPVGRFRIALNGGVSFSLAGMVPASR